MQILKEEIRQKIINESKKEFLEYGFKGMSLRSVALAVNVSPSNIYNYFKGKDEIFQEVVKDADIFIESILKASEDKEGKEFDTPENLEWHIGFINMIYKLVSVYREQLKLLMILSDGSAFEGYKEKTAKRYVGSNPCTGQIDENKQKISYFFMYNFTIFYLNYLENLVKEEKSEEEIKKYLVEMTIYSHSGFKSLADRDEKIFNEIINRIGFEP